MIPRGWRVHGAMEARQRQGGWLLITSISCNHCYHSDPGQKNTSSWYLNTGTTCSLCYVPNATLCNAEPKEYGHKSLCPALFGILNRHCPPRYILIFRVTFRHCRTGALSLGSLGNVVKTPARPEGSGFCRFGGGP
jgi:hypothetical protein